MCGKYNTFHLNYLLLILIRSILLDLFLNLNTKLNFDKIIDGRMEL